MPHLSPWPTSITVTATLVGASLYVSCVWLYRLFRRLPAPDLRKHGFEFRSVPVAPLRGNAVANTIGPGLGLLLVGARIEGSTLLLFHAFFVLHVVIGPPPISYVAAAMAFVNLAISFELLFQLEKERVEAGRAIVLCLALSVA